MKVIAVAAVTAGGKTTAVNEITRRLPNAQSLHFDAYQFEGEVDDFYQWVQDGADYNVWNLAPLEKDIIKIMGEEIRGNLKGYLEYERVAYVQMFKDIRPSSDYVIDGTKSVETIVEEIIDIVK